MGWLLSPGGASVAAGSAVLCLTAGLYLRRFASSGAVIASTALAAGARTGLRRGGEPWRSGVLPALAARLAMAVRPLAGRVAGARLRRRLAWVSGAPAPEQFVANQVLGASAGLALGVLLAVENGDGSLAAWLGLLGAAAGWWLPGQHLETRFRAARSAVGRSAMGFADFLVAAVQAGLPLEEAVGRLSAELPGRLPQLMARAVQEAALTREPLDLTLEAMAREVDDANLSAVIGAIAQARQTGGDLAGPLSGLVAAMRQERRQQLRAAARGRAAYASLPLIFVMLPGVVAPLAYIVVVSFRGIVLGF